MMKKMLSLSLDQLSEEIPDSDPVAQFKICEQKYQSLYEKVVKGKYKKKCPRFGSNKVHDRNEG